MNLPNKLTLIRLLLVPLFMIVLLLRTTYGAYISALIFTAAALTDTLDGYFARKQNEITRLGKFIDPLADKLLISAALVTLTQMGKVSAWISMIIIGREFAITGFRTIAASEGVVLSSSSMGKAKTISQIVAIVAAILQLPLADFLMFIAVILTIISGLQYIINGWKLLATFKTENDS